MATILLFGGLGGWELILILIVPILWIWALISCLKSNFKDSTVKLIWVLLIILIPVLGAILYLAIGRSQRV
jgi:hypothetical protein